VNTQTLEKPLPKPTSEDYALARLLEAVAEATLAIEYVKRGLTRNAAGKAFQAWRALLAALLRLELDKLLGMAGSEEERRWLMEKAVPRVPTTRMKALSQMLEAVGHGGIVAYTAVALDLHDYQYNGPDPDTALSKYRNRQEAARDVTLLVEELLKRIESARSRIKQGQELGEALEKLRQELETHRP